MPIIREPSNQTTTTRNRNFRPASRGIGFQKGDLRPVPVCCCRPYKVINPGTDIDDIVSDVSAFHMERRIVVRTGFNSARIAVV
jgi:hypothetical protein